MSLTLLKVTREGEIVDTGIHKNLDDDLEKCVMCHSFTAVRRSTPIDQRKYYIKGEQGKPIKNVMSTLMENEVSCLR